MCCFSSSRIQQLLTIFRCGGYLGKQLSSGGMIFQQHWLPHTTLMRINEKGLSHPVLDLKLVFNYEFFSPPAHYLFEGQMCLNKRYQIECLQLQCCFSVYFEPEYFYISVVFFFFFFSFCTQYWALYQCLCLLYCYAVERSQSLCPMYLRFSQREHIFYM